jgi:hypothetical protein
MSVFGRWLERRRLEEGLADAGDPFSSGGNDPDFAQDQDQLKAELFKTVYTKYPDETMQFLNGIAQRGDEEIASLLSKIRREGKSQFKEPSHPTDGHEVVPPGADRAFNSEFTGGGN